MKSIKISVAAVMLAVAMMFVGCGMSNTGKGTLWGAGGGAAAGAILGAIFGGEKGAVAGAAIGGVVGAGTGAIIGHQMDKKADELAKIEGVKVETQKIDGLDYIRVTFDSGILFDTGKSDLKAASKTTLDKFITTMKDMPADYAILGHTDNTGSKAVNEKVSLARAQSVATYFEKGGVAKSHILNVKGMDFQEPIADNATEAGRALNRRVEIYIAASEEMIKAAEAEAAKTK